MIKKEAAIEILRKYKVDPFKAGFLDDTIFGFTDGIDTAISELSVMPAADVRPVVKARWEDATGYIYKLLAQRVHCPVCKAYAYFHTITAKNYCPQCGAEMREGENAEEEV